jgi:hypothetical protein
VYTSGKMLPPTLIYPVLRSSLERRPYESAAASRRGRGISKSWQRGIAANWKKLYAGFFKKGGLDRWFGIVFINLERNCS